MNNTTLIIPEASPWRYALVFPVMFVLGLELVLFVRLVRRYRKPYIPLLALLGLFVLNLALYDTLLYVPPIQFRANAGNAAVNEPSIKTPAKP